MSIQVNEKTLQTNIAVSDPYDTKLCQTHTVQCHTDHLLQCWSKVFFLILPKCLFVIIVIHAYFIHSLQSSVETHLRCGGIYNDHIIANCLRVCQ